jgi:ferredoxin
MSVKTVIIFSDIRNLFSEDQWDVGFLTEEQLKMCAYSPIKGKAQEYGADYTNNIHFLSIVNSIVLVRHSPDSWDYSNYKEADDILKASTLQDWFPIYTNFKEAAILSGLGVRAKNSLIHSYRFGFDMKVCIIGFEDTIIDVPPPERVDLQFWERCDGCSDCRIACPVGAIHNEEEPCWLDSGRCDDFIGFGDHPGIPSIKRFWHKHVHPEVPQEVVDSMKSCTDLDGELSFDANGYTMDMQTGVLKDSSPVPVPFCRECQVQPRCSKWNGDYPYDAI